jgi:hypothetical protein
VSVQGIKPFRHFLGGGTQQTLKLLSGKCQHMGKAAGQQTLMSGTAFGTPVQQRTVYAGAGRKAACEQQTL